MAIAKMNRFTLLTFHAHKEELLKQLQVFGDVHFRNPDADELAELPFLHSDFSQEQLSRYEMELEKVRFAAGKIAPYTEKPKLSEKRPAMSFEEFDRYTAGYDYNSIYEKVKEQDEAIAAVKAEAARRAAESDAMAAWVNLDVTPGDLAALDKAGYLVGTVNRMAADEFFTLLQERFDTVYAERLDVVKDDVTLLLLFPSELYEELNVFAREQGFTRASVTFRDKPASVIEDNRKQIEDLQRQQRQAEEVLQSLAPEHAKLQVALDYFETVLEREQATHNFLASDTTLMIEGWVPVDESAKLRELLGRVCGGEYFLEEQEVEKSSAEVPIKLKNNAFVTAFESITGMYAMPKYNEVDPTPILAPFYWLFFGMMVGDIGYGAVVFLATTLALKLLDLKEGMRSFMSFFRYLSISIILMGFVYGGAFGVTVFAPVPVYENGVLVGSKAILDSQLDITTMLIVSIIIGIIHLVVGLLTKAYMGFRDGDIASALFDGIFWLVALLAGIGWLVTGFVGIGGPAVMTTCKWLFWAAMIGIAATQGRESPSIGGKIGNGLYGAYGITSYVGDVVSYTRIVALGLSGAYIAYAFNLMGGLIPGAMRWVFGLIIIVLGQTLNLGLALLGAYVHSCRLQYVEFFGKFYEGGGVVYRPLALKTDHIHIKK